MTNYKLEFFDFYRAACSCEDSRTEEQKKNMQYEFYDLFALVCHDDARTEHLKKIISDFLESCEFKKVYYETSFLKELKLQLKQFLLECTEDSSLDNAFKGDRFICVSFSKNLKIDKLMFINKRYNYTKCPRLSRFTNSTEIHKIERGISDLDFPAYQLNYFFKRFFDEVNFDEQRIDIQLNFVFNAETSTLNLHSVLMKDEIKNNLVKKGTIE